MPLAPRSPRPRMRPPSVTQMTRTSLTGQLRSTSLTCPLRRDRQVHAARPAVDVAEFQAGLGDGRVVHDGQEAGRVRHERAVEEGLVVVQQVIR